ncbi:hypothetical protein VN97_g730 [Penicillium thymicola]|uniref:Uncharacterized protein n=1 Tax=Penicillium thymicola TaxID=293382 RepID=A0AAI9TS81_PENTH|nr:hypothetical protein VN97_g730 [Penicillium thymicola]
MNEDLLLCFGHLLPLKLLPISYPAVNRSLATLCGLYSSPFTCFLQCWPYSGRVLEAVPGLFIPSLSLSLG